MSVGGLGDVEAVEQSFGLVGLRSGYVGLAGLILYDSRDEVESVAVIVGGGVDDVDHVEAADGFLRGNLGDVDRGRRFDYVDYFADFALVGDGNVERGAHGELHVGFDQFVETLFFHFEFVGAGGEQGEAAASGEIGFAEDRGLGWRAEEDTGGGDGYSIFVGDGDGGGGLLSRGSRDQ